MSHNYTKYASLMLCILPITILAGGEKGNLPFPKLPRPSMFTPDQRNYAKFGAGAIIFAVSRWAANRIDLSENARLYNGKYASGFYQALQFSGACFAAAPLFNELYGDHFVRFGTRAPIVAGIAIVAANPKTQQIIYQFPYVGPHLSSYQESTDKKGTYVSKCGSECQGVCPNCFIVKGMLLVGAYKIVDPLVDKVGTWIGKKFGIVEEDEKSNE